jgi:hypothetical protein
MALASLRLHLAGIPGGHAEVCSHYQDFPADGFRGRSCGLFRVVITHRADHSRSRYRPETLTGGGSCAESRQCDHV